MNAGLTFELLVAVITHVDRQGMSVISAVNLTVENTIFSNTAGTAPAAGVDLEPDFPHEALVNVTFKGCACVGNAGGGFRTHAIWSFAFCCRIFYCTAAALGATDR